MQTGSARMMRLLKALVAVVAGVVETKVALEAVVVVVMGVTALAALAVVAAENLQVLRKAVGPLEALMAAELVQGAKHLKSPTIEKA